MHKCFKINFCPYLIIIYLFYLFILIKIHLNYYLILTKINDRLKITTKIIIIVYLNYKLNSLTSIKTLSEMVEKLKKIFFIILNEN